MGPEKAQGASWGTAKEGTLTVLVYEGMSVGNSSAISSVCEPDSSKHDLMPASTPARI